MLYCSLKFEIEFIVQFRLSDTRGSRLDHYLITDITRKGGGGVSLHLRVIGKRESCR
jgi:hypothetical protein